MKSIEEIRERLENQRKNVNNSMIGAYLFEPFRVFFLGFLSTGSIEYCISGILSLIIRRY